MKKLPITSFFGQPSLFSAFDDAIDNILDYSVDYYKYRTTLEQKDNNYIITAQVPGMSKDDITIKLEDSILKVTGEKQINETMTTSINKEFTVSSAINTAKIQAKVENGILTISIPQKENKCKEIKIN
jgi:HSP20 family protein